ncbi:hypothetical protein BU24DRAFT_422315 [Aaosphaeria arxii CBS 175.79]|uniref:Uncharacterized protein n=1 Tax=Aaosphaeria arxii CBS 175.79 TaxID=1450172 RepID=A0A6A5XT52_9PLEO|nr:uncharacterized protein BU24DRAFT_422315 [Aaosphaeria arxii CBS 175.79]KAF2015997.1 hypothetical protein BU24DRAFT_422315 [Aaosphaeria arxii CBS 175.79]
MGTQCKAATSCGYCAQEHDTRNCPSKSGQDTTKKCALCRGEHEARNRQCPARKAEAAKMKSSPLATDIEFVELQPNAFCYKEDEVHERKQARDKLSMLLTPWK